jgi:YggT family protein
VIIFYVVSVVQTVAYLTQLAILARAIISWLHLNPYSPLVRFLERVTDPILRPFRKLLPTWQGVDFSPVAALLAIQLLEYVLVRLIVLA